MQANDPQSFCYRNIFIFSNEIGGGKVLVSSFYVFVVTIEALYYNALRYVTLRLRLHTFVKRKYFRQLYFVGSGGDGGW